MVLGSELRSPAGILWRNPLLLLTGQRSWWGTVSGDLLRTSEASLRQHLQPRAPPPGVELRPPPSGPTLLPCTREGRGLGVPFSALPCFPLWREKTETGNELSGLSHREGGFPQVVQVGMSSRSRWPCSGSTLPY